jgi:proline dehydrogenase
VFRQFFIALSESRSIRKFAEHTAAGQRMSKRFVAGMEVEDALTASKVLNDIGITTSIDNLGENVTNVEEARASAALYHKLLDEIHARGLNANVSVKLTHMGLDVSEPLAKELVCGLVNHAAQIKNFLRVDMEGSPYTDRTLIFVRELHRATAPADAVGTVLQAYMRRSMADAEQLCAEGIRIRLCKGAYKEPADIAFQKKSEVDGNYINLMKLLLKSGVYHGMATHDENIVRETIRFAQAEKIPPTAFEFQMLHGIRRDLQQALVKEGWGMRVYVPFGSEWYPYYMRRLAERPANAFFVFRNLFRG